MFDDLNKDMKDNSYKEILNAQPHNELLEYVKQIKELKDRFSGMRLNKVNCTKEKIINTFLLLYQKNKIIEKIIIDMKKQDDSKEIVVLEERNIEGRGKKMNEEISGTIDKTIDKTIDIAEKSAGDLMDYSLREFINNINSLKSENEKLKASMESNSIELISHKDKIQCNNTEAIKLSDKLKVANNTIKEKNSLISNLSTRIDKLEKSLNEKFETLQKEVKKTVPAVDSARELIDKNDSTLKEILVNVKEERKALSKLQDLESVIKGIENKVSKSVIDAIQAILQEVNIEKRKLEAYDNEEKDVMSEVIFHIEEKDNIKIQREVKEDITSQSVTEEDDDELSKMLNDIKNAIM